MCYNEVSDLELTMNQPHDYTKTISTYVKATVIAVVGVLAFVSIVPILFPKVQVAHVQCKDGNIQIVSAAGITFQLLDGKDQPVPCPKEGK
jgi:hypothetical protein